MLIYILKLYWIMYSKFVVCVCSLQGFLHIESWHLPTEMVFLPLFQFKCLLCLFFFLFLPVLPVLCSVELAWVGKPSVFPTDYDVSHGLFINGLNCVEEILLYLFYSVFIMNGCWILSNALSVNMIMWSFFCLLMWLLILTGFWMLYQLCIPGINPSWSQCVILFIHFWIQFASIWWGVLYPYSWEILICGFLAMSLSVFGINVMLTS